MSRELVIVRAYGASHLQIQSGMTHHIGFTTRLSDCLVEITIGRGRRKRHISLVAGTASAYVDLVGERVRFYLCRVNESSVAAADDVRSGRYDLARSLSSISFTERVR